MRLPAVPAVDDSLVDRHELSHRELAAVYADVSPEAAKLFVLQQHRLVVEALANVQPSIVRPQRPRFVVPPRAYLTLQQQRRIIGARAVFRHIDSRVEMRRCSLIEHVVESTTPVVLHALLEATEPDSDNETNPGMMRVTPTEWSADPFAHPSPDVVRDLMDEAVATVNGSTEPGFVRAAWLTYVTTSVHPFVDGNGRVAAALYLATVADSVEMGVDWGALEQWALWRDAYITALRDGRETYEFDPARMSAASFVDFAGHASIAGAELCAERLRFLQSHLDVMAQQGLSRPLAFVHTFVAMRGVSTLRELSGCGLALSDVDDIIAELVRRDRLRWVKRPHGRRTSDSTEELGLAEA